MSVVRKGQGMKAASSGRQEASARRSGSLGRGKADVQNGISAAVRPR